MEFVKSKNPGRLVEKIQQVALPLCEAENFELVQIECCPGRENIIRIYVDKPGGITLNDCAYISRHLGDLIDIHLEEIGRYRLEISSPGPNRPLNKKEDFLRFTGKRVKIEVHEPLEGQKKFTGILEKTNDDSVVIAVDGKRVEIADLMISKAMLAGQ